MTLAAHILNCYKSVSLQARDLCWFPPGKASFSAVFWMLWSFMLSQWTLVRPRDSAPQHLRMERKRHLFSLGSQYYVLSGCQSRWWRIIFTSLLKHSKAK